jgi:hypothetical protein
VTPVPPVGAGTPDRRDLDAKEQLERNEAQRLELVRSRAEKWIGGIGALTGVLATAIIIRGSTDATKIVLGWRIAAALAVAGAIILLAAATYHAYQAAYGDPGKLDEIKPEPLNGLHDRLQQARRDTAKRAQQKIARAIQLAFAAIALIAAANAITWFAPTT